KELPDKENFFKDIIENHENPDLLMFKGFIYSSLRNEHVIKELDDLNINEIYWIYKKIDDMKANTRDKNFYKLIGSVFVENLNKCNQEQKNICTPEILNMLKSEINCNLLTTNELYDSLLKNEFFNKLVKLNIDEINTIRMKIESRKKQLQKYCEFDFLIDEFSSNNRFENFLKGGVYEPFFWNSKQLSPEEKDIIKNKWLNKIDKLIDLEKKTNMNDYIDRLLTISESLRQNELFTPEILSIFSEDLKIEREKRKDYLNDNGPIHSLIDSTNISDNAKKEFNKRRLKILGQEEISTPEPSPEPSPDYSTKINNLRNEIDNIDFSNILNLADGNDLHQKITNSNIPKEEIAKLQQLREDKLNELVKKQYDELNNTINNSRNVDDLSKLENDLSNNNLLTNEQKNNLLSSINAKKDEIKNESEFTSLQNLISEETD
ncbi:1876_t:CDS:2, partial [Cetraspora pellucida]